MDWLTRLPVLGPVAARLRRTHAWHAYETLERVKWARLSAAITFTSFVALFPLLTVGAAVTAAVLGPSKVRDLEGKLAEQVPGISKSLDLGALVDNAGTVGVVAGALLLFTGVGWVGSLRECLRAVWELEESPGNPFLLRLRDAGVLLGLGAVALLSFGCSGFASAAVGWAAGRAGLPSGGAGGALLPAAGFCAAVLADVLLLCYLLTRLPRVQPHPRTLLTAALIGAVGLEVLKLVIGGYLSGVAAKSMYGAFGTPVALLLWINFTAKLLLFCAAWTATARHDASADLLRAQPAQKG
ncbi:YihY/virulence factor BrkB family protein [Streptomyces sp. AV19]|uniref:YihY/virulence factor BrkB family protein n=1 Tax=Streptomyces sp. AV19 TaxID=2793068 RepID=UPI0018FE308C|nr:YihY/virulence factor BrkB family protein [Streptomyces sp. AV19]MBH1935930.1 YihY/virulence factor BrkB family protein [Streptomyces sp. AV19]MDG4534286.1 YihY/virulence factor BrkB family protein [Streptomyces sp. AV19]